MNRNKKYIIITVIIVIAIMSYIGYVIFFEIGHHYKNLSNEVTILFTEATNQFLDNASCKAYVWRERNELYINYTGKSSYTNTNKIEEKLKESILNVMTQYEDDLLEEIGANYYDLTINVTADITGKKLNRKKIKFIINNISK
jgi:hypothetical protein